MAIAQIMLKTSSIEKVLPKIYAPTGVLRKMLSQAISINCNNSSAKAMQNAAIAWYVGFLAIMNAIRKYMLQTHKISEPKLATKNGKLAVNTLKIKPRTPKTSANKK